MWIVGIAETIQQRIMDELEMMQVNAPTPFIFSRYKKGGLRKYVDITNIVAAGRWTRSVDFRKPFRPRLDGRRHVWANKGNEFIAL